MSNGGEVQVADYEDHWRVAQGGSWFEVGTDLSLLFRLISPDDRYSNVGFRLALHAGRPGRGPDNGERP